MTAPPAAAAIIGRGQDPVRTGSGRVYQWKGETFRSVTTIISGGVPKSALPGWAARVTAEEAVKMFQSRQLHALVAQDPRLAIDKVKGAPWRQRDAAAQLGSAIHDAAEQFILGMPVTLKQDAALPYVRQFADFLKTHDPVYEAAECTVFSRKYGYAGTLDAIVTIEGRRYILDYKSAKSGIWGETCLQLAAYRHAEFIGLPNGEEHPMIEVDGALALHLQAGSWRLLTVPSGMEHFIAFRAAKALDAWSRSEPKKKIEDWK